MSGKLQQPCLARVIRHLVTGCAYILYLQSLCVYFTLYSQGYTVEYVGYKHEWEHPPTPATSAKSQHEC